MFEHLKRLDVAASTSWLDMPELGKEARLLLRPATEANPAYYNAMLKRAAKRVRRLARADSVTVDDVRQNRDDDRDLFPLHVIVDWEGVRDDQGEVVPHSRDAAKELCQQLPEWSFDRVRSHAATPERFLPEGEDDPVSDLDGLLGNSSPASTSS
jgi:hypothetical protein